MQWQNPMLRIYYCHRCLLKIEEHGCCAAEIFDSLVEYYMVFGKFLEIKTKKNSDYKSLKPVFKFLENKGYIVSTEIGKNLIAIKPMGIHQEMCDNDKVFKVCLDLKQHF